MYAAALLASTALAVVDPDRHLNLLRRTATRCGVSSQTSFVNFEETIISNMPVMYPRDDDELGDLLAIIAQNGCKARPVGATHSSWSVVTAEDEAKTVGISLAEYVPNDAAWRGVLNTGSKTVRAPAGWSLHKLIGLIRPDGYFLPTQTAGAIFALGGVVTNGVHGGAFGKGFINEYVVALRVAVWTASGLQTRVITDEAELRHWRNSFGLLGIVTGVELQVVRRDGFLVRTVRHSLAEFTREAVDAYVAEIQQKYTSAEAFFDPYRNELITIVYQEGRTAPAECFGKMDNDCRWHFWRARCRDSQCCQYRYKFGDIHLSQSCRTRYVGLKTPAQIRSAYGALEAPFANVPYFGAPDLSTTQNIFQCALEVAEKLNLNPIDDLVASAYFDGVFSQIEGDVKQNANDVNDGFWLRASPYLLKLVSYSVPVDKTFDLLSIIGEVFDEVSRTSGVKQLGTPEFRFITVGNRSTLFPTGAQSGVPKTGQFVNSEIVFSLCPKSDLTWATTLQKYEERMRALDGFVHTGKSFCYAPNAEGVPTAYADEACVKSVFNAQQKAVFGAYRETVDPLDLFDGGAAEFLN